MGRYGPAVHAWDVLLQQLVVGELLRVGVGRDAVDLEQVNPRDLIVERLHSAHVAFEVDLHRSLAAAEALGELALRQLRRLGAVGAAEHGQHRARVHHRDVHVHGQLVGLPEELELQAAIVAEREEHRVAEDHRRERVGAQHQPDEI